MSVTVFEVEQLYRCHGSRLRRLVRLCVGGSEATIDDACQAAWGRLIDHRSRVRSETALAWVIRTAVREAARLSSRDRRTCSLEDALARGGEMAVDRQAAAAEDRLEQRTRLAALRALPVRQQRLLWLRGLGLSYAEMAAHEGCSRRTVERQLLRAGQAARGKVAGFG